MRKAAFILNIIGAVFAGISAIVVFFLAIGAGAAGAAAPGTTPNPEEAQFVYQILQASYWVSFLVVLAGFVIQIVAAVLNKNAVSKSSVMAPAILSIIFGGLLGILAGIFLLVANDSEYASPL